LRVAMSARNFFDESKTFPKTPDLAISKAAAER
jgi:hypothetical protein